MRLGSTDTVVVCKPSPNQLWPWAVFRWIDRLLHREGVGVCMLLHAAASPLQSEKTVFSAILEPYRFINQGGTAVMRCVVMLKSHSSCMRVHNRSSDHAWSYVRSLWLSRVFGRAQNQPSLRTTKHFAVRSVNQSGLATDVRLTRD